MLRYNCLRNAQNIVATKETLLRQSYHTEKKKNIIAKKKKKTLSQLKKEGAQDSQVATDDCIPVTKTQNSVATQLLDRDREGKSGPKCLGIHT